MARRIRRRHPIIHRQAAPEPVAKPSDVQVQMIGGWPLQKDCTQFYGNPHAASYEDEHIIGVTCPWRIFYEGRPVHNNTIRIHRLCSASLMRVLNSVWDFLNHDQSAIEALRYHKYSGSFVVRNKRGGSTLSMHAYGCAIDWDDEDNVHHSQRHLFTGNSPLIIEFKKEGWIWGGDWHLSSVDAMHVQAARIY